MKRLIRAATMPNDIEKLKLYIGEKDSYPGSLDKGFNDIMENLRAILADANEDEVEVAREAASMLLKSIHEVSDFLSNNL